ncbi:DUF736 domain-containing protein [Novosphingobium resinovorum]|uniref:DUF736 domain-containing protein n=1 Tax=Novosphingobium resinovorum TaxID=158500 RepID=UPI002ED0DC47|nr:DUF736 domain-containing protein [Novosphingobium resinovorum]
MRRRREIGHFKRSKQGGWEGEIQTLTIQRKVRLMPNDNRVADSDPAFRVMLGWQAIGDAWERQSRADPPRDYLRVRIDDPLCPISAALFPDDEGMKATLVMNPMPAHAARQTVE